MDRSVTAGLPPLNPGSSMTVIPISSDSSGRFELPQLEVFAS